MHVMLGDTWDRYMCIDGASVYRGDRCILYMEGTGLGLGLCIEGTGDVYERDRDR